SDMRLSVAVFFISFSAVSAHFSDHFNRWLETHYNTEIKNQLERRDVGSGGSFGGKSSDDDVIRHHPVIFVHGVSDIAGGNIKKSADHFRKEGYTDAELYGTTYFNGAQGNALKWTEYTMKCEYVKQVRALIVSVRLYTGRAVDVVAYSMGVPVSRKAILGGRCVDTGEDLGAPLTGIVDTYVGTAGPNHGVAPQVGALAIPGCALPGIPICNQVNGLYSGNCPQQSQFLNDINAYARYEGQHIYTIASTADHIVGYNVCNQPTSAIAYQDGGKVFTNGWNHDDVFKNSVHHQLRMARDHVIE
ncbi:hypothetical protein PFISCL1PPCAC_6786, partial [Pristionchus fissidentatus]